MNRNGNGAGRIRLWWRGIARLQGALPCRKVRIARQYHAPTRRGVLLALLYGAVALPGIISSVTVASRHSAPPGSGRRGPHLSFPPARSAGTIRTAEAWDFRRGAYRASNRPDTAWDNLGPARGRVPISSRELVWLELNEMSVGHPEVLSGLPSGLIFRLSTVPVGGPMDQKLAARIAQFTGLRELDLRYLPPPLEAWEWESAFPWLECAWLPAPGDARERERLMAWCARGGLELSEAGGEDGVLFFQRAANRLTSDYGRGKMMPTTVVRNHEGGLRDGEAEEKGSR